MFDPCGCLFLFSMNVFGQSIRRRAVELAWCRLYSIFSDTHFLNGGVRLGLLVESTHLNVCIAWLKLFVPLTDCIYSWRIYIRC